MADELGLRVLSVWDYSFLGEAYAGSGQRHEAIENLKKVESMFRKMGMDYSLGKAQEALAKL